MKASGLNRATAGTIGVWIAVCGGLLDFMVLAPSYRQPLLHPSDCSTSSLTGCYAGSPEPGETAWLTLPRSGSDRLSTLEAWIDFVGDSPWIDKEPGVKWHRLEPDFDFFKLGVSPTVRADQPSLVNFLASDADGRVFQNESAILGTRAAGVCDWAQGFGNPDFNGDVRSLTVFDDGGGEALFAGGDFTIAGQEVVNCVARWDGSQWSALTGPLGTGVSGSVRAMVVYDDGDGPALYLAGDFDSAGGIDVQHVAKWDGSQWSALTGSFGTGTSLRALALEVFDDGGAPALYVGGPFVQAGGTTVNRIARWDGSQWSALGGPAGTGVDGGVMALIAHDDGSGEALYAGGTFTTAGGVAVNRIARWDGSQWSALTGPSGTGTNGEVFSLVVYNDGSGSDLYAGGSFGSAGGVGVNGIARWKGGKWSALTGSSGTGVGGTLYNVVYSLTVHETDLFVGGKFASAGGINANRIARWDGTEWSAMSGPSGTGTDALVYAMTTFDDGGGAVLYAGGEFTRAGGVQTNQIAAWNSVEWSSLDGTIAHGMSGSASALAVYDEGNGQFLYAGGDFLEAGQTAVNNIARWSGSEWAPLESASGIGTSGPVRAFAVYDDGGGPDLYVGGTFVTAGGVTVNNVARWDGVDFTVLGDGLEIGVDGEVRTLVVYDDGSGDALFVGGAFQTAGGITVNRVARWDGSVWSALTGPSGTGTDQKVETLEVYDDGGGARLFAGGSFATAGGIVVNHVAEWTGDQWLPLIGPIDVGTSSTVYALESWDDGSGEALYAGGTFVTAGGLGTYHVARWDGSEWSWLYTPFGIGVDDRVETFAVADDGRGEALFVGGRFTSAGSVIANHVARWDGSEWTALASSLGSGTERDVLGLIEFNQGGCQALYVVGSFETAGGIASRSIARWSCSGSCVIFIDGFESGDTAQWSAVTW